MTDEQKRTLACVLDEIIPPSADGRMPGAGEAGVAEHVAAALRSSPELEAMVEQSLAALDAAARARGGCALAELPKPDQRAVIDQIAASEHALPPVVMLHAYAGYYHNPRVLAALGLEARPPHPRGYEMARDDLSLLEQVRARPPLFRRV
jgi:hypothetical protein